MSGSEEDEEVFVDSASGVTPGAGALGGSQPQPEPSPEPAPQGQTAALASPWWALWCERIGAGEQGLDATRTALAFQLQAQAHAEKLAEAAQAERVASAAAQQAAFETQLALRDLKFAELEGELKSLRDKEDDKEPEHREFSPRAADNPFGVVVGSERKGKKAEPCLRHYSAEKAYAYLEENGGKPPGKDFYNFQVIESAAEALFDVVEHLKLTFPIVVAKVNPKGSVDELDPAYIAERELCKVYNTVKAVYDNVINPQLSYLQVEAILHKKYGSSNRHGWITQVLGSIQKSIHGLIGTPLPDNLAPKFNAAMQDLEERFSNYVIKSAAQQASRVSNRSPFQQYSSGGFGSTARSREAAGQPRRPPQRLLAGGAAPR